MQLFYAADLKSVINVYTCTDLVTVKGELQKNQILKIINQEKKTARFS